MAYYESRYVDRGDPAAFDFTWGSPIVSDGAFHDLDLSGIVPAGTKAVHVWINIREPTLGTNLTLRKKGHTNNKNVLFVTANSTKDENLVGNVAVDTDRIIQYNADNGKTFTKTNIIILGWYL